MKTRILAAIALAAAVVVGTSGCTFLSRQATTIDYDAADQVSADLGEVKLRSILLLTESADDPANLLLVAVNEGPATLLHVQYTDATGNPAKNVIHLPAYQTSSFGFGNHQELLLTDSGATPGGLLPLYFQQGSAEGVELSVPILSGDWEQYESLIPVAPITSEKNGDATTEKDADKGETSDSDGDTSGH